MPNAETAFGLLRWCAAPGPPGAAGPLDDLDAATLDFLRSRQIDSLHAMATGADDPWQEAYDAVWELQLRTLREAMTALEEAGVTALAFKGCELIPRHFGGRPLGITADADLLVPRDQIEQARSVLYKLDYRHAWYSAERGALVDTDVAAVAELELSHYELAPFRKLVPLVGLAEPEAPGPPDIHPLDFGPGGAVVAVEIDLHHNVATDADAEPFFERAVPSTHGVGATFSPADHVWFNLSRYYNEVALHDKRSLRPIAYTVPEVASGAVDWDVVERVAGELALGPTLYYYLALCDRLAPGHVPESTLAAVRASTKSRMRDWGWQLGKLFDFEEEFPAQLDELARGAASF
ncbi:MAG: nucleotidyltransferase family protein [Actinomycetota bacterium]|nr:nucleotidyltransferase family protein [Actinomycetota bacterium]